jgi:hypothetical protein
MGATIVSLTTGKPIALHAVHRRHPRVQRGVGAAPSGRAVMIWHAACSGQVREREPLLGGRSHGVHLDQ